MGPAATLDSREIGKIFIRSTNWIGDAVMTTPAMGAVRAAFPRAEIVVAANPVVAELLCHHPDCDRLLVYDKKGPHRGIAGLLRFAAEVRKERFDLAILFQNAIEAAIMTTLARIPRRAGYTTDCRALLLTHRVRGWRRARRRHHTDYYCSMLAGLGIEGGSRQLRLRCTEEEQAWARERLGDGFWVAINAGATYGSAKRWFPERFAAVADEIASDFAARILLIGGPDEDRIGREVAATMRAQPLNLAGRTSVRQLMALLSQCRLLVTNDSGPMHVAAAFGVPIVAIFGSTDHTTTSPLSASCRIVRQATDCAPCLKTECPTDHHCMTAVSVAHVLDAVRSLLSQNSTPSMGGAGGNTERLEMNTKTSPSLLARLIERVSTSRTAATRKFAILLACLLLITDHCWSKTGFLYVFLSTVGLILVGIGALGRVWASMYISGYKDKALVTEGAYSVVRNPLYVFSFIGAVGVGCATGSLILIGLLILGFFLYYPLTTLDEEQRLAARYGQEYTEYVRRTPRYLPDFSLFHENRTYSVDTTTYRYAFLDAVWFVWIYALLQLLEKLHAAEILPTVLRIP